MPPPADDARGIARPEMKACAAISFEMSADADAG